MKKLTAFTTLCCLVVMTIGCGEESAEPEQDPAVTAQLEKLKAQQENSAQLAKKQPEQPAANPAAQPKSDPADPKPENSDDAEDDVKKVAIIRPGQPAKAESPASNAADSSSTAPKKKKRSKQGRRSREEDIEDREFRAKKAAERKQIATQKQKLPADKKKRRGLGFSTNPKFQALMRKQSNQPAQESEFSTDAETSSLIPPQLASMVGVGNIAFSPDGSLVATEGGSKPGTAPIQVWKWESGEEVSPGIAPKGFAATLKISKNNTFLSAIVSSEGKPECVVWEIESGREVARSPLKFSGEEITTSNGGFSSDSKMAVFSTKVAVTTIDLSNGTTTQLDAKAPAIPEGSELQAVVCSPNDPDLLAVAVNGSSGHVQLHDLKTLKLNQKLEPAFSSSQIRFSPDGAQLFSSSFHGEINIWETASWQHAKTARKLKGTQHGLGELHIAPDSKIVASKLFLSGKLVLWDVESDVEIPVEELDASALDFSGDGSLLVSSFNEPIRVIDPATGTIIHQGEMAEGEFSADPFANQRTVSSPQQALAIFSARLLARIQDRIAEERGETEPRGNSNAPRPATPKANASGFKKKSPRGAQNGKGLTLFGRGKNKSKNGLGNKSKSKRRSRD